MFRRKLIFPFSPPSTAVLNPSLPKTIRRNPFDPIASGYLKVQKGSPHQIYWAEYGNPNGMPAFYLHGGPGARSFSSHAGYFDPEQHRVIVFDQRGGGRSTPSARDWDARPALKDNTTNHSISDIQLLRSELSIRSKMIVAGGSWGTTLAMAYGIRYPELVHAFALRGVFLCRRPDVDYFYQGNALLYSQNPAWSQLPGAYKKYPKSWARFMAAIPKHGRGDVVMALAEIFNRPADTEDTRAQIEKAAVACAAWESGISSVYSNDGEDCGPDPETARGHYKIENHYMMNGGFLGGSGVKNRNNNHILDNVRRLKDIPFYIVQGLGDEATHPGQAHELIRALLAVGNRNVNYTFTNAGHSGGDPENQRQLKAYIRGIPPMSEPDYGHAWYDRAELMLRGAVRNPGQSLWRLTH